MRYTRKTINHQIKNHQKKNHQKSLNELDKIMSKLFPDNILQERKENFLNYYLSDKNLVDTLIKNLDPLKFYFNRNPGLSFPIFLLDDNKVKVSITLNSVEKLVTIIGATILASAHIYNIRFSIKNVIK